MPFFPYHLTPAYGRDYKSAKEVREDFEAGKDFCMEPSGHYCSIRDIPAGMEVFIRYSELRKVARLTVPPRQGGRNAPSA